MPRFAASGQQHLCKHQGRPIGGHGSAMVCAALGTARHAHSSGMACCYRRAQRLHRRKSARCCHACRRGAQRQNTESERGLRAQHHRSQDANSRETKVPDHGGRNQPVTNSLSDFTAQTKKQKKAIFPRNAHRDSVLYFAACCSWACDEVSAVPRRHACDFTCPAASNELCSICGGPESCRVSTYAGCNPVLSAVRKWPKR